MTQQLNMGKIIQFPRTTKKTKAVEYESTDILSLRIERIRQSLVKINALMAELKRNQAESK